MEGGWVKIYYSMQKWEWYDVPEMVALFVHLIIDANYEDRDWHGMKIERGQLVTSVSKLAKRVGISIQQTRTCLSRLESTGEIVTKSTNKFTIITISNYDRYQSSPETKQQTNNKQATTPKEYKNINNNTPTNAGAYARTHVGEQGNETPPQAPPQAENWRYLSSARRFALGNNPDVIAEYKKKLIAEELSLIAGSIGMPKEAQEMFLVKWCEHNPGSEMLRADYEQPFNIKDRATQFMSWWKKHEHRDRDKEREERLNVNAKWGR